MPLFYSAQGEMNFLPVEHKQKFSSIQLFNGKGRKKLFENSLKISTVLSLWYLFICRVLSLFTLQLETLACSKCFSFNLLWFLPNLKFSFNSLAISCSCSCAIVQAIETRWWKREKLFSSNFFFCDFFLHFFFFLIKYSIKMLSVKIFSSKIMKNKFVNKVWI